MRPAERIISNAWKLGLSMALGARGGQRPAPSAARFRTV